jgi:hypothetical protein
MRAPQTKALGRMTGHVCKCGAVIVCPTRARPCAKKHVLDHDAEGDMCVVCMEVPREVVFVPCGHLVGCMQCVEQIKESVDYKNSKKKLSHMSSPHQEYIWTYQDDQVPEVDVFCSGS